MQMKLVKFDFDFLDDHTTEDTPLFFACFCSGFVLSPIVSLILGVTSYAGCAGVADTS